MKKKTLNTLNNTDIDYIKQQFLQGKNPEEIAQKINVHSDTIKRCIKILIKDKVLIPEIPLETITTELLKEMVKPAKQIRKTYGVGWVLWDPLTKTQTELGCYPYSVYCKLKSLA
jgi:myosin-crossreactive antigen